MPKMVFINLPVADVPKATAFYAALGAVRNPAFSNEQASAMVVSDTITFMLLSRDFFGTFTPREVADARTTTEVLVCLSEDSREAVDAAVERGRAAGGRADPGPKQDHGFMYGRSVEDPDGHIVELMWMDPAAVPPAETAFASP